jgi:hypothetical protein
MRGVLNPGDCSEAGGEALPDIPLRFPVEHRDVVLLAAVLKQ